MMILFGQDKVICKVIFISIMPCDQQFLCRTWKIYARW